MGGKVPSINRMVIGPTATMSNFVPDHDFKHVGRQIFVVDDLAVSAAEEGAAPSFIRWTGQAKAIATRSARSLQNCQSTG